MKSRKRKLAPATFDVASLLLVAAFAAPSVGAAERARLHSGHKMQEAASTQQIAPRVDPGGGVTVNAILAARDRTAAATDSDESLMSAAIN